MCAGVLCVCRCVVCVQVCCVCRCAVCVQVCCVCAGELCVCRCVCIVCLQVCCIWTRRERQSSLALTSNRCSNKYIHTSQAHTQETIYIWKKHLKCFRSTAKATPTCMASVLTVYNTPTRQHERRGTDQIVDKGKKLYKLKQNQQKKQNAPLLHTLLHMSAHGHTLHSHRQCTHYECLQSTLASKFKIIYIIIK